MFAKKKQPPPPYVLQVLTPEYLIAGTVEGNAYLEFPGNMVGMSFAMTSAEIQSIGVAEVPVQSCAHFVAVAGNAVALIPRTDVTQLEHYALWKEFKQPLQATFYLGPYLVRGRMMYVVPGHLERGMPVWDVRITCADPDARWEGLSAPFALVNTRWLRGYEPV